MNIPGLHHITAIAGDARQNVAFYTSVLDLRLAKKTVNFDDPGTYHLYYGDQTGSPGSILTFFPFAGAQPGRAGFGSTSETALATEPGSLEGWMERFADVRADGRFGLFDFEAPSERYGQRVLRFRDPDGLSLALIERPEESPQHGRFHSVTLALQEVGPTAKVLEEVLGMTPSGSEDDRIRYTFADGPGAVDLMPSSERERRGSGTVHHVAFRARDEEDQLRWQDRVMSAGIPVTEVKDRQYFKSIYFREPGGVLFEIATDPPGFTVDEPMDKLGQTLKLPSWLEPRREAIQRRLPNLETA